MTGAIFKVADCCCSCANYRAALYYDEATGIVRNYGECYLFPGKTVLSCLVCNKYCRETRKKVSDGMGET